MRSSFLNSSCSISTIPSFPSRVLSFHLSSLPYFIQLSPFSPSLLRRSRKTSSPLPFIHSPYTTRRFPSLPPSTLPPFFPSFLYQSSHITSYYAWFPSPHSPLIPPSFPSSQCPTLFPSLLCSIHSDQRLVVWPKVVVVVVPQLVARVTCVARVGGDGCSVLRIMFSLDCVS